MIHVFFWSSCGIGVPGFLVVGYAQRLFVGPPGWLWGLSGGWHEFSLERFTVPYQCEIIIANWYGR